MRALDLRDFDRILSDCAFVLSPVAPYHRLPAGRKDRRPSGDVSGDIYTVPVNIAGCPSSPFPADRREGLPIGMQLIGRAFDEPLLYRAGYAFEESLASTKGGRWTHESLRL